MAICNQRVMLLAICITNEFDTRPHRFVCIQIIGEVLPNCNVHVSKVPLACLMLYDATFHQRVKYRSYVSPPKVLHVISDFTEQIYIFFLSRYFDFIKSKFRRP